MIGTLLAMVHGLNERLDEAAATGTRALVTGCPACYIFLSLAAYLTNRKIPVCHTVELVGLAAGDPPPGRSEDRCRDLLAVVIVLAGSTRCPRPSGGGSDRGLRNPIG